jgi:hypothetical protein
LQGYSPKEILNSRGDNVPIVGQEIVKIIENNHKMSTDNYRATIFEIVVSAKN